MFGTTFDDRIGSCLASPRSFFQFTTRPNSKLLPITNNLLKESEDQNYYADQESDSFSTNIDTEMMEGESEADKRKNEQQKFVCQWNAVEMRCECKQAPNDEVQMYNSLLSGILKKRLRSDCQDEAELELGQQFKRLKL